MSEEILIADGFIYLEPKDLPNISTSTAPDLGDLGTEDGETHKVEFGESWTSQSVAKDSWTRLLASWDDPFTLPKTRTKCVKKAHYPGGWTCVGWKTEKKILRNRYTLIVQLKSAKDIKKDIDDCIATAAIGAAIAAFYSGGSAAITAAESLFFACLESKLPNDLVSVHINVNSSWSKWK